MRLVVIFSTISIFLSSCYILDNSKDPDSSSYEPPSTGSPITVPELTTTSTTTTTIFSQLDVKYEAEKAILSGGAEIETHTTQPDVGYQNASEEKYIKGYLNSTTARIRWSVYVEAARTYTLSLCYAAGLGDPSNTELWINGTKIKTLSLHDTGNWWDWDLSIETINLDAGLNTIDIRSNSENASNPCANFDYIKISTN